MAGGPMVVGVKNKQTIKTAIVIAVVLMAIRFVLSRFGGPLAPMASQL